MDLKFSRESIGFVLRAGTVMARYLRAKTRLFYTHVNVKHRKTHAHTSSATACHIPLHDTGLSLAWEEKHSKYRPLVDPTVYVIYVRACICICVGNKSLHILINKWDLISMRKFEVLL